MYLGLIQLINFMLLSQTLSYMAERVVGTGSFGVVFQVKLCLIGSVGRIRCLLKALKSFGRLCLTFAHFFSVFFFPRLSA